MTGLYPPGGPITAERAYRLAIHYRVQARRKRKWALLSSVAAGGAFWGINVLGIVLPDWVFNLYPGIAALYIYNPLTPFPHHYQDVVNARSREAEMLDGLVGCDTTLSEEPILYELITAVLLFLGSLIGVLLLGLLVWEIRYLFRW